ncbi:RNA polymerase factor sigma-54 [Rhodocaloribacter litoris]|uniref:RNA polymerase factor sigma-54 n=1 Tax=Rhodocaloribacter litoris TaxID=2558931 RepID=UPI00142190F3|nr:RNA polymerase factor sigma-54 [Rhodocaloribacter litoris]QXD16872.1 RNA polymerase factor sigma-54 [Rhodocaloribacter litoris]
MLNLQQKQTLQQKLSPQQIQYIKLLQLPTLALEQRIKAELEANPLLEEGEEDEELQELEDNLESEEPQEAADTAGEEETAEEPEIDKEEEYDWDEYLNSADDLYGYKARVDQPDEEDRRELPMPARVSMTEHLMDQLLFLDLDETDTLIAEQIIGSIDEDGYLRRPLESIIDDIAFNHGVLPTEDDVERVLRRIQRLDPPGIAARDLRECLLVQLELMDEDTPGRDVARRMLQEAYKAFTMKHFDAIMKKLGVSGEELKEAYDLIQRLNPKPGEGEFTPTQNYITPDFTVRYIDGEFIISLNSGNAPQLRISRQYRQMLEKLSAAQKKGHRENGIDAETKAFLKSKLESARWFINSINQRRQTMLKVMHAIVQLQEDFFKFGEGYLKPMILKDVAELIDMDISTVSRVVNGKYVQCDFGVYELKYFFSEGLTTESGEEVSNKEVKAIIESIIAGEDKKKPLSDQKIAKMLEKRGFKIARRTVTKYREQLGIPVARLRKEIVLQ